MWRKIYYNANSNQNEAGVAKLKPDNVDFKMRINTMGKKGLFQSDKGVNSSKIYNNPKCVYI